MTPATSPHDTFQAPALQIDGVCKRFGSVRANDNISLTLRSGEVLALLGENGAGKTTLMNILFGHYRADQGSIHVFGQPLADHTPQIALQAGIGMVHQHFTLADNLTVLDNIILGTESLWQPFSRRRQARARLQTLIDDTRLAVDPERQVSALSVGERQRVEILKALYRNARILILDEPTAVLTPQEVDDLFELLRHMAANGLGIIIISHKLQEVMAISDRVVVLRQGAVAGAARTAEITRDDLASMIVGRFIERPMARALQPGADVLTLTDLHVKAAAGGQQPLLDTVNLSVAERQIVGVAGVSGNGQSVLCDIVSGVRSADAGHVSLAGATLSRLTPDVLNRWGVARIPEDRHRVGVIGDMSLWENLLLDDLGQAPCWRAGRWMNRQAACARAETLVADFDVRCASIEQPSQLLSGGNIQKLILARNLSRQPRLIIANQPTRGLDEGAIAAVHQLLLDARSRGAAVLLIAEDLDELLRISDLIVVMHNGRISAPVPAHTLDARRLGLMMSGATPLDGSNPGLEPDSEPTTWRSPSAPPSGTAHKPHGKGPSS